MLRIDLVVNNFLACAVATGEIRIMSDGSPGDRSFIAAISRGPSLPSWMRQRSACTTGPLTLAAMRKIIKFAMSAIR